MHKVRIRSMDSFLYAELFKVVERRNGKIYRTERVGFVKEGDMGGLSWGEDWKLGSLSTSLTRQLDCELDLLTRDDVNRLLNNKSV